MVGKENQVISTKTREFVQPLPPALHHHYILYLIRYQISYDIEVWFMFLCVFVRSIINLVAFAQGVSQYSVRQEIWP